jgi:hypothetical protein
MTAFNPFRCESEIGRRLGIAVFGVSVVGWLAWVGIVSDGFNTMKPIGWTFLFGLPVAVYFLLRLALPMLRKTTRDIRLLLSACAMWTFSIAAWGYIAQWEEELSPKRFLALIALPPFGFCLAFLLWKWSKASK